MPFFFQESAFENVICKMAAILFRPQYVDPSAAETRIFQDNLVITMTADGPAPCVAGSSAAMLLTMQDKEVLVFHEEGFQLFSPSKYWELIGNANMFLHFLKWIWHVKSEFIMV